jgi:hypothetical protein
VLYPDGTRDGDSREVCVEVLEGGGGGREETGEDVKVELGGQGFE